MCAATAASNWWTRPGNFGRAIRCPYHSWTYGLDGALRAAPYFGGREPRAVPAGFDRGQHGLVPVRSAVWHDWVFVNLDGGAPPFEDFTAPLRNRLDGFDLSRMQHLATVDFGEVAANWKLLVENFVEPYHVQFVHSGTTEQPLTDHYTVNDPGCLGCAVDVSRAARKKDALSQDSRFLTLFPNFVFGLYLPDQIGVHLDVPLAPGRTLQRRAIYSLEPGPVPAGRVESLARLWREVHREDHAMCERLQQGTGKRRGGRRRRPLAGLGGRRAELPDPRYPPPAVAGPCSGGQARTRGSLRTGLRRAASLRMPRLRS